MDGVQQFQFNYNLVFYIIIILIIMKWTGLGLSTLITEFHNKNYLSLKYGYIYLFTQSNST